MGLDQFDRDVLNASGDASDLLKQFYNLDVASHSAQKYVAGIRHHLRTKEGMSDTATNGRELEAMVLKADGSKTTTRMLYLSAEDSQDPLRIMELMGLDPFQWELIEYKVRRNYWDTTIKNSASEAEKSTNHAYMCTLRVKPIKGMISKEALLQAFAELPAAELEPYYYEGGNYMLELPIMDVHLGKLAWRAETGQDYDMKIAEALYRATVLDLLKKVELHANRIEKIIFPIGQDFFHVDTTKNSTTAGTQMDFDTRWQKMFSKGIELLVWAIEQCRRIAPVHICYVPGNHDEMLSYCATKTIEAYYHGFLNVTVDVAPVSRKYILYGKNLIGYSHGKEGKRIDGIMQVEVPQEWAASIYREWHLGDLHHEATTENNGIIIRRIPAITAIDAWHGRQGYHAVRRASAYLWEKDTGLELIINSNVSLEEGED